MSMHWILNDAHELVPAELLEWAQWFEDFNNRRVRLTRVGPYYVSTVFMGLSHNFMHPDEPMDVFETMVYVNNKHMITLPAIPEAGIKGLTLECERDFLDIQYRCDTWTEAIAQHESVIAEVMQAGDELEEIDDRIHSSPEWLNEHIKV